jgi:putative DNA primase/helicase
MPQPAKPYQLPAGQLIARIKANFPPELLALNYWLLWRYVWVEDKQYWTKVPYQPCGAHAKSDDPATWSSFEVVCRALESSGCDGLGCMIQPPYIGIDFDKVSDPVKDFWARQWIEKLDSYAELSVSGTGYHVWCTGDLPDGRRKCGRVEVYGTGRYFTVSGNALQCK